MSNLITGAISVIAALVFFMYYPIRLYSALGFRKSLPVWIIVIGTLACLLYDYVQSIREDNNRPGK